MNLVLSATLIGSRQDNTHYLNNSHLKEVDPVVVESIISVTNVN